MSQFENSRSADGGNPTAESQSLELRTWRDYYVIIRERLFLGAGAAILIAGLVGYLMMSQPPLYVSTGQLILDDQGERVLDVPHVVDTGLDSGRQMWRVSLENHINQLRSRSFRNYVIDSFTEEEQELLLRAHLSDNPRPSVRGVVQGIEVEAVPDSFIIQIRASHRDSEAAALIANRYLSRYLDFSRERSHEGTYGAIKFLEAREEELREQIVEAEAAVRDHRREFNLVAVDENQDLLARRLDSVNRALAEVRMDRMRLEARLRQVETMQQEGRNLLEVFSLTAGGATPRVVNELDDLRKQREVMSQRYGARHPEMIANQRAIETAEKLIADNIELAVADLRNRIENARDNESGLSETLSGLEQESLALDDAKAHYESLQRKVESVRATHARIQGRLDETILLSQMEDSRVRVFDMARASGTPSEPNITRAVMLMVFLGGFFFFGTPIGLAVIDNKLKNARDVEDYLQQKLLGEISTVNNLKRTQRPHVVAEESDDRAAESFRSIFSQMQLTSQTGYPKVILATSTIPGEGKSFVVNNLGSCFSAHGKRTLMIDFDLRRPSLHRFHSRLNNGGVLPWLDSDESMDRDPTAEDLGIAEVGPDLFLLGSGGQTKRATEAIELPSVVRMIEALKKEFDVILIDTPPLGVFTDALPLARMVDEAIYVVHFGKVERQQVRKNIRRITETRAKLLGVVMNGMPNGARFSHYYSGYGFRNSEYTNYYMSRKD